MYRNHTCGELTIADVGQEVTLAGWVNKRRNLGAICFIDLRDRYGITQITFDETFSEQIKDIRNEYVLQVKGKVVKKDVPNPKLKTGEIEVAVAEFKILSSAKTTPLIVADETDALEEVRLKYRYLDLRRAPLQHNLMLRDKVLTIFRQYLHSLNFVEVETPILSKSTPEGARDYLVPSRLYHGSFYALPQSPQIYKQLLMIGGMDRYFQVARCFRDEDLRSDRQPEFTQVDIEMSFADEEDIFAVVEGCMKEVFKEIKGIELTFPRTKYVDAMAQYGSDKPDIRFDMRIKDISDLLKDTTFTPFKNTLENQGVIRCIVFDDSSALSRKELDKLQEFVKKYNAHALAYLKYQDDTFSGSINKALTDAEKEALKSFLNLKNNDTVLIVADEKSVVEQSLGALRLKLAKDFDRIPNDQYAFTWVVDFPMYEYSKQEQTYVSCHHPFTAPKDEDVDKLIDDKANCYSRAYDLVLNGYELLSGSVRIHDQKMQAKVFDALGLTPEQAKEKFGFFLEAFEYGVPPHCGVGIGIERLMMLILGTENIKDVVAFPKTASATCLMAQAPSTVDEQQLKDLGIAVLKD